MKNKLALILTLTSLVSALGCASQINGLNGQSVREINCESVRKELRQTKEDLQKDKESHLLEPLYEGQKAYLEDIWKKYCHK